MNYSVLSLFQWIRLDANILETMSRKMEEKKDCFGTCGRGLSQHGRSVHMYAEKNKTEERNTNRF